ncbi:MAG: hypothetical protein ACJASQ_000514 [Crocinitomicaceae bacterium]|jgi:hypothetical protein
MTYQTKKYSPDFPPKEGGVKTPCPDCPELDDSKDGDTYVSPKNYQNYKRIEGKWIQQLPVSPYLTKDYRDALHPENLFPKIHKKSISIEEKPDPKQSVGPIKRDSKNPVKENTTTSEASNKTTSSKHDFVDKDPLKGDDNFNDWPRVRALHDDFDAMRTAKRHYNDVHWDSGGLTIGLAHWANSNAGELIGELKDDAKKDFYAYLLDYFTESLTVETGSKEAWIRLASEAGVSTKPPTTNLEIEAALKKTFISSTWQEKWRKTKIVSSKEGKVANQTWIIDFFNYHKSDWKALLKIKEMVETTPINTTNVKAVLTGLTSAQESTYNKKYYKWIQRDLRSFKFLKDPNGLSKALLLKTVAKHQADKFVGYQKSHEAASKKIGLKTIGGIAAYSSHQNSGLSGVKTPTEKYRYWKQGSYLWNWDELPEDIIIDGTKITKEQRKDSALVQDWRAWVIWASYLKMKKKLRERNANIWYRYYGGTWGEMPLKYNEYPKYHSGENMKEGKLSEKSTTEIDTGFDFYKYKSNHPAGLLGSSTDPIAKTKGWASSTMHPTEREFKSWPYKASTIKIYSSIKEESKKSYSYADPSRLLEIPIGASVSELEKDGKYTKVQITSVPKGYNSNWLNKVYWTSKSNINSETNKISNENAKVRGGKSIYKGSGTMYTITEFTNIEFIGESSGDWHKVKWINYTGTEKTGWIRGINVVIDNPY